MIIAFVPDLMDRSKVVAAAPDAIIVRTLSDLSAGAGDTVIIDLSRPGALDAISRLAGARVIGFGSHVDRQLLSAARAAGFEVMARSAFFGGLPALLIQESGGS
jgi:hypothetical protein